MDVIGIKIHIDGVVQGVGFRPFVYSLAQRFNLNGWVKNTSAGVDIEVDGNKENIEGFVEAITRDAPPMAYINAISSTLQTSQGFITFEIIHSETVEDAFQPISVDVCTCKDCLDEMMDPQDRRFHYPFINCTNCGPRFTIIMDIPYDRPKTSMAEFKMCPACLSEYENPLDRRFHAQPVACPDCGPRIWLETKDVPIKVYDEEALKITRKMLADGKILAIKGLGGFHLACDAENELAVIELRIRKLRVDKPYAVMMPDVATIRKHCFLDSDEEKLISSSARPILLLTKRQTSSIVSQTTPGQNTLGVMLPYTPLHTLLFDDRQFEALVMTSGNISEEPIETKNDEASKHLDQIADAFLMHDRDIHIRCDDSVVRVFDGRVFPIRRSRGYAPFPVHLGFDSPEILACGGELKNTFCISRDKYAFLSHHIGDLENYETLVSFENGINHFEKLFRISIKALAYDLHPDYLATRYAQKRAFEQNLPAIGVQHHHAHIASCMAENDLPQNQEVIGIAFDGTGYGTDGTIWGGEFLISSYQKFERAIHLKPIRLVGGDLAVRQPWRIALAWLKDLGIPWDDNLEVVREMLKTPRMEVLFDNQLNHAINSPNTTSMGRLFDAVSALAGIRQTVNYEAQAAIELEAINDPDENGSYEFNYSKGILDPGPMINSIVKDVINGELKGKISARFHNGISSMVLKSCQELFVQTGIREVVLSGGVWQNLTLLKKTIGKLRKNGFSTNIHQKVPTNDGGLSLGQIAVAAAKLRL